MRWPCPYSWCRRPTDADGHGVIDRAPMRMEIGVVNLVSHGSQQISWSHELSPSGREGPPPPASMVSRREPLESLHNCKEIALNPITENELRKIFNRS